MFLMSVARHNTGTTHYNEQLRLPDKGRAVKGLINCNGWVKEPFY